MGKGDRKSKKGKIHIGSYGKKRPARVKTTMVATTVKKSAKKKSA